MKIKACCLLMFCLLAPAGVQAQSDFNVTWAVSGVEGVSSIDLDLNEGTEYLSANGGVHTTGDLTLPVTGTCFFTPQGGANCRLLAGNGRTIVLAVEASLSGTWRSLDVSGQIVDSGTVTLTTVR